MKRIAQIRFFGDSNIFAFNDGKSAATSASLLGENNPPDLVSSALWEGTAFEQFVPILQLGIQALPGTQFNLGDNMDYPITIGQSGMYELDVTKSTLPITKLTFEKPSLDAINATPDGYLIIDIIYDDEG